MSDSQKHHEAMALFRFEAIASLLGPSSNRTLRERLKERSRTWFTLPNGQARRYSWMTLEDWLYRYKNGGLPALETTPRRDRGCFRVIPAELLTEIDAILEVAPKLKKANVLRELRKRDAWDGSAPSRSVLYRYLNTLCSVASASDSASDRRERRDFEAHYANQLWQADIMYGPHMPKLQSDGRQRRQRTYLIAVIDDHSRLLCHGQFTFSQTLPTWLSVLKTACSKRGIPQELYCDNGKVFRSDQVRRICAVIGSRVSYTKRRDAAAKGKIERFFRRVRSQFLEGRMLLEKPSTLAALNQAFAQWLESDYNRAPHRGINRQTPNARWLQTSNHVRHLSDSHALDEAFLFHTTRKVNKTGVFSLNNRRFETSSALVGKVVDLYYDPTMPLAPEVVFESKSYGRAADVDRAGNFERPRRQNRPKNETTNDEEETA